MDPRKELAQFIRAEYRKRRQVERRRFLAELEANPARESFIVRRKMRRITSRATAAGAALDRLGVVCAQVTARLLAASLLYDTPEQLRRQAREGK